MKNKIRVYATAFWQDDQAISEQIRKYGFGNTKWKNIELVDDDHFDVAVISTAPMKCAEILTLKKQFAF